MNNCLHVLTRAFVPESEGKEVSTMNGSHQEGGAAIGLIILLVILYIIFNPIPGPIDDVAVATIGGYHALKRG
jgi:hypothetical protein